jgi:hypothetical protein
VQQSPAETDSSRRYAIQVRRHKAEIEVYLDQANRTAYTSRELEAIVREQRPSWHLATVPTAAIIDRLLRESRLSVVELTSADYGSENRFAWGTPSPFEIALSLRGNSYLSHGTAVFLHGLLQEIPATFYVNREQGPKPQLGNLTQAGLDRAFSSRPRQSNLVYSDPSGRRYVVVAGKFTNKLEVGDLAGPGGETLPATKLERTLVDITVRPVYGGGVSSVLDAYRSARDRVSVNLLMGILKKLDYLYPYHQAVGFYLERAGYSQQDLAMARRPGVNFDFYLAHGITDRDFSKEWRVHFPRGL